MPTLLHCQTRETVIGYCLKNNRVRASVWQGCVGLYSVKNGGGAMKNHFDFMELLTFGLFLIALLTFVFTFCK